MPDLTLLYHRVKDTLEESCLEVNERYIGIAAFVLYRVLPKNIAAIFIDGPGVPPTGPASGDCHEPEVPNPPLVTGKAASGVRRPGAASTREGK